MDRQLTYVVTILVCLALAIAQPVRADWVDDGSPVCTAADNQNQVKIAPDGAGGAFIGWRDNRSGNTDVYLQRIDANGIALWPANGVAVCALTSAQYLQDVAPDGAGGVFLAWEDVRAGNADIYLQRVDANGNALWTAGGVAVCTATGDQLYPVVIGDGTGGAIVVWQDGRTFYANVFVQRVSATGVPLWASNGINAAPAVTDQRFRPQLLGDGLGGAILAWERRAAAGTIEATHIDSLGTIIWDPPVTVCVFQGVRENLKLVTDGTGGAIIVWQDNRWGAYDVYAQHIDAAGTIQWDPNAVAICAAASNQQYPNILTDDSGGALVAWQDNRNGNWDVFAQRVNAAGAAQWAADGIALCAETAAQERPRFVSDGAGGAVVVWQDARNGGYDIYSQRVDSQGNALWAAGGIAPCTASGDQNTAYIATDGAGGGITTWVDFRGGATSDIYAQRVRNNGGIGYPSCSISPSVLDFGTVGVGVLSNLDFFITNTATGILTGTVDESCDDFAVVAGGGVFALAHDETLTVTVRFAPVSNDTSECTVSTTGDGCSAVACMGIGGAFPYLTAVRDVPSDQGGHVYITWDSPLIDSAPNRVITHYSIWRSLCESELAARLSRGCRLVELPDVDPAFAGPAVRRTVFRGAAYSWEWIGNMQSHYWQSYMYRAPTMYDSTAAGPAYHAFVVSAHTDDPFVFWDSDPDSGYSVDNLAPSIPDGFAGSQQQDPLGLLLKWRSNVETDLAHYALYRGLTEEFAPDPGNFIAATSDTSSFDGEWSAQNGYYYKLSAVDIHGNESGFALLKPTDVTGIGDHEAPAATFLAQNCPNPFNPETLIEFGVIAEGDVSLAIYDAAGRLVRVLVNEPRSPGVYKERWDGRGDSGASAASGVYFCRLRAGSFEETRKMVLLR